MSSTVSFLLGKPSNPTLVPSRLRQTALQPNALLDAPLPRLRSPSGVLDLRNLYALLLNTHPWYPSSHREGWAARRLAPDSRFLLQDPRISSLVSFVELVTPSLLRRILLMPSSSSSQLRGPSTGAWHHLPVLFSPQGKSKNVSFPSASTRKAHLLIYHSSFLVRFPFSRSHIDHMLPLCFAQTLSSLLSSPSSSSRTSRK